MTEDQIKIATAIIKNAELLEEALKFESGPMTAKLTVAVVDAFSNKTQDFNWEGHSGPRLGEDLFWLAPPEWRAAGEEPLEGDYNLYFNLDAVGTQSNTWTIHFLGCMGNEWRLLSQCDTLGKRDRRLVFGECSSLIATLTSEGFQYDLSEVALSIPFRISKDDMVRAFEEDDLERISLPIEKALQKIYDNRSTLDALEVAIRYRSKKA